MCDYSLFEFPNRLAREGEELVTCTFPSGSLGLASPSELINAQAKPSAYGFWRTMRGALELPRPRPIDRSVCAICVPPGARLMVKDISAEMRREFDLAREEPGRFIQTGVDAYQHRDAIRFVNGSVVPLQRLCEGQRVKVLSLVPEDGFVAEHHSALTF